MGRGLTRTRSTLPFRRKRSRSQMVAGERVETLEGEAFDQVEEETIEYPGVAEKYKAAAKVANDVLKEVIGACVPGASVIQLCKTGDELINKYALPLYSTELDEDGHLLHRGIAFPCCVNVNDVACHFHPAEEIDDIFLKEFDVVRVELGVHIDGYIASACHTIIVLTEIPATPSIDFKNQCDVLRACYTAAQAALRLLRPPFSNRDVTELFRSVAHSFGVMPLQGVLSHRVKRFDEQGEQIILSWENIGDAMAQETFHFQPGQVWNLDVVFLNGCTAACNHLRNRQKNLADGYIFKKSEIARNTRLHAAKYVLDCLRESGASGLLPFSRELFQDERKAKIGIFSLVKDQLLDLIPVLHCQDYQTLARYKCTVLITDRGVKQISGLEPPSYAQVQPWRVDEDVQQLLNEPLATEPRSGKRRKTRMISMLSDR